MIVHGLALPPILQASLKSGGWTKPGELSGGRWFDPSKVARFIEVFTRDPDPLPMLYGFDSMVSVNKLWDQPDVANFYLGKASVAYAPGNVDSAKTVIIG